VFPAGQGGALEAPERADAGPLQEREDLRIPVQIREEAAKEADGGSTRSRALRPKHHIHHLVGGLIVPMPGEAEGARATTERAVPERAEVASARPPASTLRKAHRTSSSVCPSVGALVASSLTEENHAIAESPPSKWTSFRGLGHRSSPPSSCGSSGGSGGLGCSMTRAGSAGSRAMR
jgi:hypothetical protein